MYWAPKSQEIVKFVLEGIPENNALMSQSLSVLIVLVNKTYFVASWKFLKALVMYEYLQVKFKIKKSANSIEVPS